MQTTKELKEVSLTERIPLLIPQELFDKIRYTCHEIHEVEWSGVLFYKITGSIRDVSSFSIEAIDFLLMDKGNKTYTEYSFDQDVADFIMDNVDENPEFMQYKIGHIHSHNSMGVFFSGTDMQELFINCANHNFYLSLILNNKSEMIAKLVYRATPCAYESQDEDGEIYEIGKLGTESPILITHDCTITKPEMKIEVGDFFRNRLKEIIEKAKPKPIEKKEETKKPDYKNYAGYGNWDNKDTNPNQAAFDKMLTQGDGKKTTMDLNAKVKEKPKDGDNFKIVTEGERKLFFDTEDLMHLQADVDEAFTCYLIRMGEEFPNDNLDEALEMMKVEGIDADKLRGHIMPNFGNYYHKFMVKHSVDSFDQLTMDDFIGTLMMVIELLEEQEGKFDFLPPLIKDLTELGIITENKWKEAVYGGANMDSEVVN